MLRRRRSGFTLMEALISTTLLALIFLALANLQRSAAKVLDLIQSGTASADLRLRGFRQFRQDCAHFVNPGILPPGTPVIDVTSTVGNSKTGKISFFTIEHSAAGAQGLRRITYELVGTNVVRTSAEPTGFPNSENDKADRKSILADGVTGITIKFWDGKTTFTDLAGRKGLPQGLVLEMTTATGIPPKFEGGFNGEVVRL